MDEFATNTEVMAIREAAENPRDPTHDETGFSFEMAVACCPALDSIARRTYQLLGFGNEIGQTFRYRRYERGEGHPEHIDAFEIDGLLLVATALLYLNDTAAGGETCFPLAGQSGVRIAPRRGRLAVWWNYLEDGSPDPRSRHSSLPVVDGSKSTVANFLYQPPSFFPTIGA